MRVLDSRYIFPYIPDLLINTFSGRQKPEIENLLDGTLMFADISGFTAISEKLAGLGRIGGEELTRIINRCFNPLIEVVFNWQGDIIKFGGDAFLVLFQGVEKDIRAFGCAVELIDWISKNGQVSTAAGDFQLGIHAGISAGAVFNLVAGESSGYHLFCGKTVEKTYAAADKAAPGQIVLTRDIAEKLADIDSEQIDDHFSLCRSISAIQIERPLTGRERELANIDLSDLAAFIDKDLQEQLYYNNGRLEGEHRIITSLFIAVNSLRKNLEADFEASSQAIQGYFSDIGRIIAENGGTLARVDSGDSSEKILAFFGAPRSYGADAANCLKAILEIELSMKKINGDFVYPVKHKYGVNSGLCFVGDVGGEKRREYTAMGDAINLAARLMSKADYGSALVGEETVRSCRDGFEFKSHGEIAVKGKKELVKSFILTGAKQNYRPSVPMVGREKEFTAAKEYISGIENKRRVFLLITGEPGAGKSLLCEKTKELAIGSGFACHEGACFRHSEATTYGPIKSVLANMLALNPDSPQKAKRTALQKKMRDIGELEWEPLVAPLLEYYPAIPPNLKNLPEDIKKNKIESIIISLICSVAEKNNCLIIIEDIQWIDTASFDIIKLLMKSEYPPGILLISRPGDIYDELSGRNDIISIELGPLDRENSERLFVSVLKAKKPDESIMSKIIEKSGGNPFYLEEMAKAYSELGISRFDSADDIPSGIESVITARIDNLGEMVKKTVRTASVIGRIFGFQALKAIFPDRRRIGKLRDYLGELARLDLTPVERVQPVLEYIFKHILTQEVAYNGLPFSTRKTLHLKTAEFFVSKSRLVKRNPEAIARHFLLAEEFKKALPYLILSGKKAAAEFANKEAFKFYEKALEIARKLDDREQIAEILKNRGLLAKNTADYELAINDYNNLKENSGGDYRSLSIAEKELSIIYRLRGDYAKASDALESLEKITSDDPTTRVFCLNGRAEIARRGGKLPRCRELLLQALNIIDKDEIDQGLVAMVYNNLGICHWSMGQLKESSEYYMTALKSYRKLKDLHGQSKVINNLGIISDELGKLHHAAASYEKAEKIFKRIGASRSEAYSCANQGTNFLSRGYLSKAEEKLARAKDIFKSIGDSHSYAYTCGDIGHVRFAGGDIKQARELLSFAIEKAGELEDDELGIESKIRMYRLDAHAGNIRIDEIDKLIDQAKKIGSAELEIKASILKLFALLIIPDITSSHEFFTNLEGMKEIENYPELRLELSSWSALYHYCAGEKKKAISILKKTARESLSRDLGSIVSDLLAVATACNINNELPGNLLSRMQTCHSRLDTDFDPARKTDFATLYERKIELIKSAIAQSAKNQKPADMKKPPLGSDVKSRAGALK